RSGKLGAERKTPRSIGTGPDKSALYGFCCKTDMLYNSGQLMFFGSFINITNDILWLYEILSTCTGEVPGAGKESPGFSPFSASACNAGVGYASACGAYTLRERDL